MSTPFDDEADGACEAAWAYAFRLLGVRDPPGNMLYRRLGLGSLEALRHSDEPEEAATGEARWRCLGRTVVTRRRYNCLAPRLVLASLVHPDPPEELLAVAAVLLAARVVEIQP